MISIQERADLLARSRCHIKDRDKIYSHQQLNFSNMLHEMDQQDRDIWFGKTSIQSLQDLDQLPIITSRDIVTWQSHQPPWGRWRSQPQVFASSASTGDRPKVYPRSWDQYKNLLIGIARAMDSHGVDSNDVMLTTDTGGMFTGHITTEDCARFIFGACLIKHTRPGLKEKLQLIQEFGVTIFSASPTKLLRMARMEPKRWLRRPLKMLISQGAPLEHADAIADAWGVDHVTDYYGTAETGNLAWTCRHGHRHLNEDLIWLEQGRFVTNLTNLMIFRYDLGETISSAYHATCPCGSHLARVHDIVPVGIPPDRSRKD